MAKIAHSDAAPSEAVHYTFADEDFELSGRKNYETRSVGTIAAAEAHPWLKVEHDKVDAVKGAYVEQIAPKDDSMSALNSRANDPAQARKDEADKAAKFSQSVAIQSGEPQTVAIETGPVAETLAADETSKTKDKS